MFPKNECELIHKLDGDCALKASRMGRSYQISSTPKSKALSGSEVKGAQNSLCCNRLGRSSAEVSDLLSKRNIIDVSYPNNKYDPNNCGGTIAGKILNQEKIISQELEKITHGK